MNREDLILANFPFTTKSSNRNPEISIPIRTNEGQRTFVWNCNRFGDGRGGLSYFSTGTMSPLLKESLRSAASNDLVSRLCICRVAHEQTLD